MTITLRSTKGSALTHAEADANFTTLQTADSDAATALSASSGSSLVGDIGNLTGAVARPQASINQEIISLKGYGVSTSNTGAQNSAALTVLLGNLTSGTATANRLLVCPAGQYDFTEVDFANSLSNLIIRGEGKYTTRFNWVGGNAVPMFKLSNARYVNFESLAVINNSGNVPSYAIQVNRTAGQIGAPGVTGCGFSDIYIGGSISNAFGSGIAYTCDAGQDTNNDFGIFDHCDFQNMTNYGLAFQHLNSLVHQIRHCSFANCLTAAISNVGNGNSSVSHMGGSFSSIGCVSSGCGSIFELYGAQHGINATGWVGEGDTNLISMPFGYNSATGFLKIALLGCEFTLIGTGNIIVFDAGSSSIGELDIIGCGIVAGAGATLSFPTTGSRVNIFGGSSSISTISYNNEVTIKNWFQSAGAPTYTNLGSGSLVFDRGAGASQVNVANTITTGANPSVDALFNDLVYLNYGGATNITAFTNARVGKVVTFVALNGNATIVHATSTDQPRLQGNANFTMASGNSLTLKRCDASIGNSWIETGRKT